ncbi:MAG: helix-turn-helix domain-containing protein [Wujia sp.]
MKQQSFSSILKEYRIASGLNQSEIAEHLYLAPSTYKHYESGDRIPSIETMIRISVLFQVHPDELLYSLIPKDVRENHPDYVEKLCEKKCFFTSSELQLIACYNRLEDNEKEIITKLMRSLAKSGNPLCRCINMSSK